MTSLSLPFSIVLSLLQSEKFRRWRHHATVERVRYRRIYRYRTYPLKLLVRNLILIFMFHSTTGETWVRINKFAGFLQAKKTADFLTAPFSGFCPFILIDFVHLPAQHVYFFFNHILKVPYVPYLSLFRIHMFLGLSGSGSFYHQAKIVFKKPWFLLFCDICLTFFRK